MCKAGSVDLVATGSLVVSDTKKGSGVGDLSRVAHHSLKILCTIDLARRR